MRVLICISALLMMLLTGGCMQTVGENPTASYQEYTQRADVITLSAGNAEEVNERIQEIDPWPRYVGNTRIVASGERMGGAAERYRDVSKQTQTPTPLPIQTTH